MPSSPWKVLPAIALGALLPLGGCQTAGPEAPLSSANAAANLPADYRTIIAGRIRQDFFDPYSIRDVMISQPLERASFSGPVATVCVRANAKNRMGAYTGLRSTAYVFRGGQLTATDQEYAGIGCENATFEPFPEASPPAGPTGTLARQ